MVSSQESEETRRSGVQKILHWWRDHERQPGLVEALAGLVILYVTAWGVPRLTTRDDLPRIGLDETITLGDAANVMAALATVVIALHVVLWRVSTQVETLSESPAEDDPDKVEQDMAHLQQRERRINGALFIAGSSACWVAMAALHTQFQRGLTISWGHVALAVIAVTSLALAVDRPSGTWRRQRMVERQRQEEIKSIWGSQRQSIRGVHRLTLRRLVLWICGIVLVTGGVAIMIQVLWGYSALILGGTSLWWTLGSLLAGGAWLEGRVLIWTKVYAVLLWGSAASTFIGAVFGALAEGSLRGALAWLVVFIPAVVLAWQVLTSRDLGRDSGPVREYWRWRVERALARSSPQRRGRTHNRVPGRGRTVRPVGAKRVADRGGPRVE